jgi:transcriptional regulator with XRE-family HTH domain
VTAGDEDRRSELADFLRARRAAITPDEVRLRTSGRRRTPGLRREEVAELADVGLSWYTWLEQGRDIAPSGQVLESIARALRMTSSEREHLLKLAAVAPAATSGDYVVDEETVAMVEALRPHLAFVLDERFEVVAHNQPAELVMEGLLTAPVGRRNLLVWLFGGRGDWDGFEGSWARTARANLLDFRSAYAEHPGDPEFGSLLTELEATGEPFRGWWAAHEVAPMEPTEKVFSHSELGQLRMCMLQSRLSHAPWLRLRILVPTDEATRRVMAERYPS